ncbi:pyridoxal-phosphate dependent enzyme [Ruegeria meonggei]|uniref:Diaminopropionate ammonia-lyase n=1 Tax=Ruegeria meonggei TaxID=1446476 RepID=A0A1X6YYR8_9RHOB|nr:pyridoxal-phosphate dependent enzyme [Ruegeria meonggei]SLN35715.1 Diaminopropionate ammonia-lyase [Ruegeria meonggei]
MKHTDSIHFAPDFERAVKHFKAQDDYTTSPLLTLQAPGGISIRVKDETNRMGLGAFKALGAPYAVARILETEWAAQAGETLTPERMNDPDVRAYAATRTFVCASAGNHGMGVAAGAKALGANARIHLAQTVPASFADRLRAFDAEVVWSGDVYDESVAAAITDADSTSATLLADGTWPGYTEIPKSVMEGYCIIAEEMRETFAASGVWPTHVYLQAGVGGLAAAMAHMIRLNWAEQPTLIVVEPEAAACLKASHLAGAPSRSDGPESNMGRLDCKEPSIVAWHTLERCDVTYQTISEDEAEAAAQAVTSMGLPTTPSGAAGYGALVKQLSDINPGKDFRPLVIISEGPA